MTQEFIQLTLFQSKISYILEWYMNNNVVVRFTHVSDLSKEISPEIGRINGLINAENFCKLMALLGIDSNPRQPKESSVTKDITETLSTNPLLFPFMSKGILISASACETLDRNRFKIDLEHNGFAKPGVLDGGHNTFAIAKFLLSQVMDDANLKPIKNWETLTFAWKENSHLIDDLFRDEHKNENLAHPLFSILIPIEVIFPRNSNDSDTLKSWSESHRDITHARNNNAQLTDSTKANHQGFFEHIKSSLSKELRDRIEWKTNDGGSIKSADIAALALIPLMALPKEKIGEEINPVKIYSSKGLCMETYQRILSIQGFGTWNGSSYSVTDPDILSALEMVKDLIVVYDKLYLDFPSAYNKAGGAFGRVDCVRTKPSLSKYFNKECDYTYPDGFIVPIIASLSKLISYEPGKGLAWIVDPSKFLDASLNNLVGQYYTFIKFANYDPQKVGKERGTYEYLSNVISMELRN